MPSSEIIDLIKWEMQFIVARLDELAVLTEAEAVVQGAAGAE